jgi:glycerol uptake facilitator-like aquaporin
VLGALFGILVVFALVNDKGTYLLKPRVGDPMYTDLISLDVYWGRLIAYEVFLTFLFTLIYLILRFEADMRKVDRLIKGFGACFALLVSLKMSANSGGCLNPALGLAQSIYMIGLENRSGSTQGSTDAKYMWVYILGPFLGACLASLFFRLHDFIERNEYVQSQPMQFVGLLHSDISTPGKEQLQLSAADMSGAQNEVERSKVWS